MLYCFTSFLYQKSSQKNFSLCKYSVFSVYSRNYFMEVGVTILFFRCVSALCADLAFSCEVFVGDVQAGLS